jgi:hyperosmotically inducible protein
MVMILTKSLLGASIALMLSGSAQPLLAQTPQPGATWSQEDGLRIVKEVQKRLGRMTYYSVFDWITWGDQGKTIVLKGYASRPVLKDEAGKTLKDIPGIEKIDNQIEVLPLSMNDDRIRAAVYNRIYTQPALRKYNANAGNLSRAMMPGSRNPAMMAGGITNQPPMGYHAIHIIVKNGNVTLLGVVLNESDSTIAYLQANSTPGAFSVDNDLIVQGSSKPKPASK